MNIRRFHSHVLLVLPLLFFVTNAHAQLTTKPLTFAQAVMQLILQLGLPVLTASVAWTGVQMMWNGKRFTELGGPVFGGLVFGSAATAANFIIN